MSEDEIYRKCPEYCPFLKAAGTFCQLFRRNLQRKSNAALKCEDCKNPQQRMEAYQSLGLSMDSRVEMWQKAVLKHNELELGRKRQEEAARRKFASFIEDKFGSRPPLEGNDYLNNLVVNLYMVLDGSERQMMQTVLNGRNGDALIQAIDRSPKDENLLRNFRRELDGYFQEYQNQIAALQNQNQNIRMGDK